MGTQQENSCAASTVIEHTGFPLRYFKTSKKKITSFHVVYV